MHLVHTEGVCNRQLASNIPHGWQLSDPVRSNDGKGIFGVSKLETSSYETSDVVES